jgi:hypothetical protein
VSHTPGPWTVGTPNNKTENDIGIHGGDDDGYIICDMQTDGYSDEVQEANAHLIAAAPALLSLVERMEQRFSVHEGCRNCEYKDLLLDIRAAIASAKGDK